MTKIKKICVHTIARNESSRIFGWWETVKDADRVVVLDTGSTDDSLNKWSKITSPNFVFYQEFLETHFGNERQRSLDLAMENIDWQNPEIEWIIVNLDMDEYMEKDWCDKLKDAWDENYDCMNILACAHDDIPEEYCELIVFRKVHSARPEWKWVRKVHETIMNTSKPKDDWIVGSSEVRFIHRQTGTREWYQTLLQEEYEEEKGEDPLTNTLLCWEALLRNNYQDAYKYACETLEKFMRVPLEEYIKAWYGDKLELMALKFQCYFYMIECLENLRDVSFPLNKITDILQEDIESGNFYPFRRFYNEAGAVYSKYHRDFEAIVCYLKALQVKSTPPGYLEDRRLYDNSIFYKKLGIGYYYIGDYISAYNYGVLASDNINIDNFYREKYEEIVNGQ